MSHALPTEPTFLRLSLSTILSLSKPISSSAKQRILKPTRRTVLKIKIYGVPGTQYRGLLKEQMVRRVSKGTEKHQWETGRE